jgi:hypothetical protein
MERYVNGKTRSSDFSLYSKVTALTRTIDLREKSIMIGTESELADSSSSIRGSGSKTSHGYNTHIDSPDKSGGNRQSNES